MKKMKLLTFEENQSCNKQKYCYICKKEFSIIIKIKNIKRLEIIAIL